MTKIEFAETVGLEVRKITNNERNSAPTDYGRNADYVLKYLGYEQYSSAASLSDMQLIVRTVNKKLEAKIAK